MRILIDADGCPVVSACVACARRFDVPAVILCDEAHAIEREGAETVTVSKGADSVDFHLVNMAQPGDVVVTQDYGLAAMALARRARALNQNGMEYTPENIDGLLLARHTARKIRSGGGRIKGPRKRTRAEDEAFERALERIIREEKKR